MGVQSKDHFDIENRISLLTKTKAAFNDPEVQQLIADLRRVYPPVLPIMLFKVGDTLSPVNNESR